MHVLQIEHPIRDFDTWKGAFDRFSAKRQQSGVRHHKVLRPTGDPNYLIIELGFDSPSEAESFLGWLRRGVVIAGRSTGPDGRAADAHRGGGGGQGVLTPPPRCSPIHQSA